MIDVSDELRLSKGIVSPCFVDVKTGKRVPFETRHNTLSYMAAEAVAAAFGGDPSYIPSKMGFIYGSEPVMPSDGAIGRSQSWDSLLEELSDNTGSIVDVQVVDFSYAPSLGAEKDSNPDPGDGGSDYSNILSTGSNAITFHGVSNSQDVGALYDSEAFSASKGHYIYQCLLLGFHQGKYYIIARASLKDGGRYLQKPEGFEVALDWTVVFR